MNTELVQVRTADGLRLDGLLHPSQRSGGSAIVDALVCLHGVGSNFYGSSLIGGITPGLLDAGISLLRVNTRGHDTVYTTSTPQGAARQGAAYERVSDCVFDIRAWSDFLSGQGFKRVGVLGHSLGAIKAIYSEAYRPRTGTACVIAISPPRLSYEQICRGPGNARLQESISLAERAIADGRPDELLEVLFPFPMLMAAAGYLEKYGPQEKYDIVRFAAQVTAPCLITYGSRELEHGGPAFAGVHEQLRVATAGEARSQLAVIDGADHNYMRREAELVREMLGWLHSLDAAPDGE